MAKLTTEREANRCTISARDCDEARKYLEVHLELEGKGDEFFAQREGLLLAAIVSYSRAFISAHGKQFAALMVGVDLGTVFRNDISKINLHKTILERRNNVVAHPTWQYNET